MGRVMATDIHTTVRGAVATVLERDLNDIALEHTFDELHADELDAIQIIMKLEETYLIEISDTDAEHLTCVSSLISYLQERV